MADNATQASFNAGEWSPQLFARVDMQKYRSAAALLQNFFVDYRGGASTRAGTQYIIQCKDSSHPVRLIPFQAAYNIGYILEFGQNYIRFIYQGSPVLENPKAITGATQANPCVLTIVSSGYAFGDWIYVSGIVGMTQLNGRFFIVTNVVGSAVTIEDTLGNPIDSTLFSAYISGGQAQRIYTLVSPYAAADLALLKFTQATTQMIICHPSYVPYTLTLISAINWTIVPTVFGSTAGTPTFPALSVSTTLPKTNIFTTPNTTGQANYSYTVTSIDAAGQESLPATPVSIGPYVDYRTYGGSNQIFWNPVAGAVAYNVYAAEISYFGHQPAGVFYGFIGSAFGTTFIDSDISPDFSEGPPVSKNPFVGTGVAFVTVTSPGTYTSVPGVTFSGGSPTTPASGYAILQIQGTPTITAGGTSYVVGDSINFNFGIIMVVTTVSGGTITAWAVSSSGSISSGSTPTNPIAQYATSGSGTGATMTATWGVGVVVVQTQGLGYVSAPTVVFSAGTASANATLSPTGNGNPSVPSFFQQRLVLAASTSAPATFWMSQPGSPFNFNTTNPVTATNAITGTLVSNTLNSIKNLVSVPSGLLVLTDKAAWVVTGGFVSQGISAAVSPTTIVAGAQSFIGSNDMPPIVANYDILFVESNGAKVRDLAYNIYFNVFMGTDISIMASHLFYGFNFTEWAWAEQPFYEAWMIRNDGVMVTLTFLKEQEFIGWSHQTTNGLFLSVATITEPSTVAGVINSVYTVVSRAATGGPFKYIERVAERVYPNGLSSVWSVDSGLQYNGAPAVLFQGAEHLSGLLVTGLSTDNLGNTSIIPSFTMMPSGTFVLIPTPPATGFTVVTLGLAYTCRLQTLPLDLGEPTIQGKTKKITAVDVRVNQTLGLTIGSDFTHQVVMKDLVPGNVSSMLTGQSVQIVNGLYTGDAYTFLDPTYTVPGQYAIQQALPYPASILGVFPRFTVDREPAG